MKIISWNCNGALRNKTEYLDTLSADILVIQECENPVTSTQMYRDWAGEYLWTGSTKNKGIGVFARNGHTLSELHWTGEYDQPKHTWKSEKLQSFLPCLIDNEIPLLAVWTKKANAAHFGYIGQFWIYLQIHREKLRSNNQIICGDFNSNAIWDSWDRWWNHSDVIEELAEMNLRSVYHELTCEIQGKELKPTFFLQRNRTKPYHIDYFFTNELLLSTSSLSILSDGFWLEQSDHLPLVTEIGV